MKIMLQGYLHNANFGDILFAKLFYNRCLQNGFEQTDFYQFKNYGIGQFCRDEIGYKEKKSLPSCFGSDALVIISGGSFWNNSKIPYDAKIRYRRFIFPARVYQLLGKPVYVLGAGGGPVDTPWLRKKMVKLLDTAKTVYFRDEPTKQVFAGYGVKNEMTVTADTALVITPDMLDPLEEKESLDKFACGRKKILLHIPDGESENKKVLDNILPGLISFLAEHKEYALVLSNDNIRAVGQAERQVVETIRTTLKENNIEFYDYKYHRCWQMCSLINEMDCVVTVKLHVGVVGSALGKCVVAFPVHREKTDAFYHMIDESERCVNMRDTDSNKVYAQLNKFHDKPVCISEKMRAEAEKNLAVLDRIAKGED